MHVTGEGGGEEGVSVEEGEAGVAGLDDQHLERVQEGIGGVVGKQGGVSQGPCQLERWGG